MQEKPLEAQCLKEVLLLKKSHKPLRPVSTSHNLTLPQPIREFCWFDTSQ